MVVGDKCADGEQLEPYAVLLLVSMFRMQTQRLIAMMEMANCRSVGKL